MLLSGCERIFATTTGYGTEQLRVVNVPVVAGKASATLTTTQAGIASIPGLRCGQSTTSARLTVGNDFPATASSITLQPSPGVVPRSVGTTTGSSTLIATVRDASGILSVMRLSRSRLLIPLAGARLCRRWSCFQHLLQRAASIWEKRAVRLLRGRHPRGRQVFKFEPR